MIPRIVFHIDFDYFYAQCEEIRKPDLKTKPVAVCIFSDRGGDSGAIATANYTARKFDVKSGIPIKLAKQRLQDKQDAVFLPADFEFYSEISSHAMEIIKSFGDIFEYVGRDEAYLDVTNKAENNFDTASHIAQQLKNQIRERIKLTCSVGISPNKLVSKIASDFKKPDGLTVVKPEQVTEFLNPLKVRDIPGIGKKTEEIFLDDGLETIEDLSKIDIFELNKKFGRKTAAWLFNASKGIDDESVQERQETIQISKISTLKQDSKEYDYLIQTLNGLCEQIHSIVLEKNKLFRSVGIQFIQQDMTNKTRSRMLKNSTSSLEELQKNTSELLREALEDQEIPIRRLGVKVSEFSDLEGQSSITSYF